MKSLVFLLSLSLSLSLTALPAVAENLVSREVISERPLAGAEGMVVTVSRLTVQPGGYVPLHTHPGDEYAVVVTGGQMTVKDGTVLEFPDGTPVFFPAGSVHGGLTNTGPNAVAVITTHILPEGLPFSTPAE